MNKKMGTSMTDHHPGDLQHQQPGCTHFVYIVECANGSLYTGYSTNVDKRIATHNAGKGAKYTRTHRPVVLLAYWPFSTKGEALRTERAIKRLPHVRKLLLVQQGLQREVPPPA